MQAKRAALYLRSSKDRNDVSIDRQRKELQKLAAERGLMVVQEYADVVESGKDEFRPGFQQMLADMRASSRQWAAILMLDTGRLARRRLTSIMFEEIDAKRYGIAIIYKNLPELEEAESMLLKNQLQGLDEYHSLISRRKALGGMATNVERGFRAGGRAPRGYRLKTINTGVYREGREVLKSVLEPSDDAVVVQRYLKARATGSSRHALCLQLSIRWPENSLIGMERNALTYAGHTVWNVHNEFQRGRGYKNGQKWRPRSEWVVKRGTHPALISDDEAEILLAQVESNQHRKKYRTKAVYLLSGILQTPAGGNWHGNGIGRYRAKDERKNVSQEAIETAVIGKIFEDMRSPLFAKRLTSEAKRYSKSVAEDPAALLRPQLQSLIAHISRMMDLAAQMSDASPALRKIEELERQRKALSEEIERLDTEYATQTVLGSINDEEMGKRLAALSERMADMHREEMKDLLADVVDRVVLDPTTLDCQIHYRIPVRESVASPRGRPIIPILRVISDLKVAA